MVVIWKKNGLRLRVLAEVVGNLGEPRFLVQKETAGSALAGPSDPLQVVHGLFSIKREEAE